MRRSFDANVRAQCFAQCGALAAPQPGASTSSACATIRQLSLVSSVHAFNRDLTDARVSAGIGVVGELANLYVLQRTLLFHCLTCES